MNRKYNYFYKITNTLNDHYYYGIHSTDNLNDGYMGSGHRLHYAYKKYGIKPFKKEILKFFDTREECAQYEAEIVTEQLILDPNCYNIKLGGEEGVYTGTILVIDVSTGKLLRCQKDDDKYKSGQYRTMLYGKVVIYDEKTHKNKVISKQEYDKNKNMYITSTTNNVAAYDNELQKYVKVSREDFIKNSDRYIAVNKHKCLVKDKNENYFLVDLDDPRYISGELVHSWKGKKHTEETKEKIRQAFIANEYQKGTKNSQFGTCWIHNERNENKKISKSDLSIYLNQGWLKGRIMKDINEGLCWVHNENGNKKIHREDQPKYLENGWRAGRMKRGEYDNK